MNQSQIDRLQAWVGDNKNRRAEIKIGYKLFSSEPETTIWLWDSGLSDGCYIAGDFTEIPDLAKKNEAREREEFERLQKKYAAA